MQRSIRVILKTVRPMDSDYRVRSILVNEDDVLLAYDNSTIEILRVLRCMANSS